MNTPVSFELAKVLKEKGFESKSPIAEYWNIDGKQTLIETWEDEYDSFHHEDCPSDIIFICKAPTIADVVMWLYEKYEYWCYTYTNGKIWYPCIQHKFGDMAVLSGKIGEFNSPTEAYEAAIFYVLNNLI